MTFLAIDAQKSLFTLQKNQLQFEQTLVQSQVSWLQKEMASIQQTFNKDFPDATIDENPQYLQLQKQEEVLTTRTQSIENQVNTLNEIIASSKTIVQNNIKSGCGLNLIGG